MCCLCQHFQLKPWPLQLKGEAWDLDFSHPRINSLKKKSIGTNETSYDNCGKTMAHLGFLEQAMRAFTGWVQGVV